MNEKYVWIHFNIYTGKLEKMDSVIEKVLFPFIDQFSAEFSVKKWFFIRYINQNGPHIRLRVSIPQFEWKEAIDFMKAKRETVISTIDQLSYVKLRRLIPINNGSDVSSNANVELGLYDPEVQKYGGKLGMEIGEKIFYVSSQMLQHFISSINNQIINRFELALNIMKWSMEQASFSKVDTYDFMKNHLHYWGGKDTQQNLIPQLEKQAEAKSLYVHHVYDNGVKYLDNASISIYLQELKELLDLAESTAEIHQSKSHLLFHYIHMMNNKLGVWPIEEAYLAALHLAYLKSINEPLTS